MEQTNRTILFEELNSRKESILSMIGAQKQRESLTDEELYQIRGSLAAKSFEEVIEKFEPAIYMYLDTDSQNVETARTALEENGRFCPLSLCTEGSFFEALSDLMDCKRKGEYVLDSIEKHLENVLPCRESGEFLAERDALREAVSHRQYQKADRILQQILSGYDDGIFLIKTFLGQVSDYISETEQNRSDCSFVLGQESGCEVYPLEISSRFRSMNCYSPEENQEYRLYLQKRWESAAPSNKTLLLLLLELACPIEDDNKEWMINYYYSYLDFYKTVLKKFWWEAKPLYEVLFGIKSFFDQYTLPGGSMKPELLVTNCRVSDVINGEGKDSFRLYLETVNRKNDGTETIWYAILPGAEYAGKKKKTVRERFLGTGQETGHPGTEAMDLCILSELLAEYQIFSFLSAQPVWESTFRGFIKEGIAQWQETFHFLESAGKKEYIIPCYPNFTIMPGACSTLAIGYENVWHPVNGRRKNGKAKTMRLGGLHVEASYIAAGLTAACQCPDYLEKHYSGAGNLGYIGFGGIQKGTPGVAYQLCREGHNRVTVTQMFSETTVFPKTLEEEIDKISRGMAFVPFQGRVAARTDRVFAYRPGVENHIAAQQTVVYMERKIRKETQDFKGHLVKEFFQERPGSMIAEWRAAPNCVNGILKRGEEIKYQFSEKEDACRIEIYFTNVKKDVDIKMNQ